MVLTRSNVSQLIVCTTTWHIMGKSAERERKKKHKEKKEKREKPAPPAPSTSKATPKQAKAPPAPKSSKKSKKPITDDDVLTFEQKKDLSDTISKLDGAKLEKVIQIIHDGVPEIRDVS